MSLVLTLNLALLGLLMSLDDLLLTLNLTHSGLVLSREVAKLLNTTDKLLAVGSPLIVINTTVLIYRFTVN